jgi:hypothetical protein
MRKNYNPWGRKVDELASRKGLTFEQITTRMKQRGYPAAHPKHALNRAMQRDHWKAITPLLNACVGDVMELDENERRELWDAHLETGRWALREFSGTEHGNIQKDHKRYIARHS